MIQYLLLFQFVLLYWTMILLGLVVYGSDFDSVTGKLYLLPMLVLPIIHRFHGRFAHRIAAPLPATLILLGGAAVALLAYRPLHFGYWDEHSLSQAVLLSVLGLFSYLASHIAAQRLSQWQGDHRRALLLSWLITALLWAAAVAYPMFPLLGLAIILAVASVWQVPLSLHANPDQTQGEQTAAGLRYVLFILAMDLSLVIWDYQVDNRWGWQLALLFGVAALGCWIALATQRRWYWPVIIIACLNFLTSIFMPAFVIQPMHSACIGLCLGWVVTTYMRAESMHVETGSQPLFIQPMVLFRLALPWIAGLALGNLFYANLAYAHWRFLVLLPLILLLARRSIRIA